jgi:hypothetical protein
VQFIAVSAVEPKRIGTNLSDSPVCPKRVKTGKAHTEQMSSGLGPKADPPICALMSTRPGSIVAITI